jgi:hypothetical protein
MSFTACASFYNDFTDETNLPLSRNQVHWNALPQTTHQQRWGAIMPRPQVQDSLPVQPIVLGPRTPYWVVRADDVWFIKFEGADYGPYLSEREAILFAVDAANTLGEQGQETQVLMMDEAGETKAVWTFGQDPYPPRL